MLLDVSVLVAELGATYLFLLYSAFSYPHSLSPFLQRCDESLKWYRCCEWMLQVPQNQTKEVPQLHEWITKVNHTLNSGSSLFSLCRKCILLFFWLAVGKDVQILWHIKIFTVSFHVGSTLTRLQNKTQTFEQKVKNTRHSKKSLWQMAQDNSPNLESVWYASTKISPQKTDTQTHKRTCSCTNVILYRSTRSLTGSLVCVQAWWKSSRGSSAQRGS